MKKLLAVALLVSLFAGQAHAQATIKRAPSQIPRVNKKVLMEAKKAAEKQVSMYKSDISKLQAKVNRLAKQGKLKQLAAANAKFRAANTNYSQALRKLARAAQELK